MGVAKLRENGTALRRTGGLLPPQEMPLFTKTSLEFTLTFVFSCTHTPFLAPCITLAEEIQDTRRGHCGTRVLRMSQAYSLRDTSTDSSLQQPWPTHPLHNYTFLRVSFFQKKKGRSSRGINVSVILDKAGKTFMSKLDVWGLGRWLNGQNACYAGTSPGYRSPEFSIRGCVWCYKPVTLGMGSGRDRQMLGLYWPANLAEKQ